MSSLWRRWSAFDFLQNYPSVNSAKSTLSTRTVVSPIRVQTAKYSKSVHRQLNSTAVVLDINNSLLIVSNNANVFMALLLSPSTLTGTTGDTTLRDINVVGLPALLRTRLVQGTNRKCFTDNLIAIKNTGGTTLGSQGIRRDSTIVRAWNGGESTTNVIVGLAGAVARISLGDDE